MSSPNESNPASGDSSSNQNEPNEIGSSVTPIWGSRMRPPPPPRQAAARTAFNIRSPARRPIIRPANPGAMNTPSRSPSQIPRPTGIDSRAGQSANVYRVSAGIPLPLYRLPWQVNPPTLNGCIPSVRSSVGMQGGLPRAATLYRQRRGHMVVRPIYPGVIALPLRMSRRMCPMHSYNCDCPNADSSSSTPSDSTDPQSTDAVTRPPETVTSGATSAESLNIACLNLNQDSSDETSSAPSVLSDDELSSSSSEECVVDQRGNVSPYQEMSCAGGGKSSKGGQSGRSSTASVSSSATKSGTIGGNKLVQRPIPNWQQPITSFFQGSSTSSSVPPEEEVDAEPVENDAMDDEELVLQPPEWQTPISKFLERNNEGESVGPSSEEESVASSSKEESAGTSSKEEAAGSSKEESSKEKKTEQDGCKGAKKPLEDDEDDDNPPKRKKVSYEGLEDMENN